MPSIDENSDWWNTGYNWSHNGDEWSEAWGGPEAQWFGTILPRIRAFLPADIILEIAPGFGRWTQFLKDHCKRLIVVDLSERCIEACKERFTGCSHIDYYVNDGFSLQFVSEESIDFVFSFDSLVHAEANVIEAYLGQLATKLNLNGAGFIHHSNIASYIDPTTRELPPGFENKHWRASSVSAKGVEEFCEPLEIQCISQEKINWGEQYLNDALSTITRKGSAWARPNRVMDNPDFMKEAAYIRSLAPLYSVRKLQSR